MAQFDVDAARKAGYSDDDILKHLTETRKFDVDGAIKAGYSKPDIISHLSGAEPVPAAPAAPIRYGLGNRIEDDPNMGTPEPSMEPGLPGAPGEDITGGARDILSGEFARGGHRIFTGAAKAASPAAAAALPFAPLAVMGGAAGAALGNVTGRGVASMLGASPDQEDFAGDVASIPFGALGGRVGSGLKTVYDAAVYPGAVRSVVRELPGGKGALAVIDQIDAAKARAAAASPRLGPPRVIRDGSMVVPIRPADASPVSGGFEPPAPRVAPDLAPATGSVLPTGRIVGGPNSPRTLPPPPAPVGAPPLWLQQVRAARAAQSGILQNDLKAPDVEPIYPAGGVFPSGRSVGPKFGNPNAPNPAPVAAPRIPIWQGMETKVEPPVEFAPLAGTLPSGRTPPRIAPAASVAGPPPRLSPAEALADALASESEESQPSGTPTEHARQVELGRRKFDSSGRRNIR